MLHILLLFSILLPILAVVPMISIVRSITYSSAISKLDCGVCKEALYLTWGQSPQSPEEFAKHSDQSCHVATRHTVAMESICKTVLHAHAHTLFKGHIHRGKFDCLMTGATTCEEVSQWSVHCDQEKKRGRCQAIPIH
jgi:hypothetical protein